MYIKEVKIQGFKSYKEQNTPEPFDPTLNVVVGANGSGKSNFFHAIRFVLSDVFSSLGVEERQQFLHEGAGHAVTTATVEIILDNSDRRFPINKDDLSLKRSIGTRQDEFFIDGKHMSRAEFVNILETAGISRFNPYYVVQQGKIMAMANMKDSDRLDLIKELGGSRVYEQKRKESFSGMEASRAKRQQIQDTIGTLQTKIQELDNEKVELSKFRALEKDRKSIEFMIRNIDLEATDAEIQNVEAESERLSEAAAQRMHNVQDAEYVREQEEKEIVDLKAKERALKKDLELISEKRESALNQSNQAKLDFQEAKDQFQKNSKAFEDATTGSNVLKRDMGMKRKDLDQVKASLNSRKEEKTLLQANLVQLKCREKILLQKAGEKVQFGSATKRNAHLNQEILAVADGVLAKEKQISILQEEIEALSCEIVELSQEVANLDEESAIQQDQATRVNHEIREIRAKRNDTQAIANSLRAQRCMLENQVVEAKENSKRLEKRVEDLVPFDIRRSLNACKSIINEHRIEGVHGPIADLITCEDQFQLAVEVAAKNSLFHVVVDSQATARRVIKYLLERCLGRVTFIPLDTITPKIVESLKEFPKNVARPLHSVISCDPQFEKAVQQVFGKFMVCEDMDTAINVAALGYTCVTTSGEEVAKRGSIRGGYYDAVRSKLGALKAFQEASMQAEMLENEETAVRKQLFDQEQAVLQLQDKIELLQLDDHRQQAAKTLGKINSLKLRDRTLHNAMEAKEEALRVLENAVAQQKLHRQDLEAQLSTPLKAKLSPNESSELENLRCTIPEAETELSNLEAQIQDVDSAKKQLEDALWTYMEKKLEQYERTINAYDEDAEKAKIEEKERAMDTCEKDAAQAQHQLQSVEGALRLTTRKIREQYVKCDEALARGEEKKLENASDAKSAELMLARKAKFRQKRNELVQKIRELGTIPEEAFAKYSGKSIKALQRLLKKVYKDIQDLGYINKMAADQYTNFMDQRAMLEKREDELNRSETKVAQLVKHLDLKKDECIQRTFQGVSKNFKAIFSELVPGGKGELIMLCGARVVEDVDEDPNDSRCVSDEYVGVKVRVNFGSDDTHTLVELSGGQKTIVALALIFALQRCDPAPFYLFDEIDAALDPQYRTTVAKMIKQQSMNSRYPAQFIVTTFHPQIVEEATQVYSVQHSNRISRVEVIAREDAYSFFSVEEGS